MNKMVKLKTNLDSEHMKTVCICACAMKSTLDLTPEDPGFSPDPLAF